MTLSGASEDLIKIFSGFSQDLLRALSGPSQDPLRTLPGPSQDPLRIFSEPFQDPLRTLSGPSQDSPRTLSGPYQDPLRTFWGLGPTCVIRNIHLLFFLGILLQALRDVPTKAIKNGKVFQWFFKSGSVWPLQGPPRSI